MDDEKHRRRDLETDWEMSDTFNSKHSNKRLSKSLEQVSDEESFSNEIEDQSMDLKSIGNNESALSKDITYSSVSMSEGEGDADFQGLTGRVTELNEVLQEKEAVYEALHAEYDHLGTNVSSPTSSHSHNSNIPNKDLFEPYCKKFQEFERAIIQRDNLIEELTSSLQQAITSRDGLVTQISILNSTQLGNFNNENTLDGKVPGIEYTSDSQKQLQVNSEESNLNISETNQLQKQCEEKVEKISKEMKTIIDKFAAETNTNNIKHENEIKELMIKHEEELQKLKEANQNRFATEMSEFQKQLLNYEQTIESLKLDLINTKESHLKEKEVFDKQIKVYKLQLEEMASKYVATASVLDSKESIERSLDQVLNDAAVCKAENEALKFKLEDIMSRYMDAQNLLRNGQVHERNLTNKISTLEKSLSRLSGISLTEMDETTYQTIDEISFQRQMIKKKLEEKENLEKDLTKKIEDYEKILGRMEDDKKEYEKKIKNLSNTCEYLMKRMNSNLDNELQQRFSSDSLDGMQIANCEIDQINELKKVIEKRDMEIVNYMKRLDELNKQNQRLEDESNKLKIGLASAYAECAVIEEKLDQTLGLDESKFEDSTIFLDQIESFNASTDNIQDAILRQSNCKVIQKLEFCRKQFEDYKQEKMELLKKIELKTNENKELLMNLQQKEEQYREEIKKLKMESSAETQKYQELLMNFEERENKFNQSMVETETKHTQEMEELRKYFEQKCLQMEKQYSEEVFSLQSRKMSDNDSEIEDLTEDLYVGGSTVDCLGGGGDALGILEKEKQNEQLLVFNNEHQKNNFEENIAAEYKGKLEDLKKQLEEVKKKTVLVEVVNQSCQTEQSSTTGVESNELNELRADYNRQLEEQVGLARIDILNALQERMEILITSESASDENWPTELLELRNKFTSDAERKLQSLKERHAQEIKRMKEGNNKIIYELQEEIKRLKTETHESLQNNILQERDVLHKTCATLKDLVSQLVAYFNECEEELNSSLISEVLKKQLINRSDSNLPFAGEQIPKVKRVHFAPQSDEISSIIRSDNLHDLLNKEQDIKKILKTDLDACLQRLKADSAKILNVSYSDSESWSTGPSDNPNDKLMEVEKLLIAFQEENEHLKVKIIDLQQRLILAENKKEVISEGYGVQDETLCKDSHEDFSGLQDRAKHVVLNGSNDTGYLIQLIEELYKHADKRLDDTKREKEDLQHQIEAADKQLRSMRKFQEEQAVERENERDEAAKQIQQLQERLREREREKDRDYRITSSESALSSASSSAGNSTLRQIDESEIDVSVEVLTSQLREMEVKKAEAENELKCAITKIWELKEIIRDLDKQAQLRADKEDILNSQIEHLKEIIISQTKNQETLVNELEALKSGNESNQLSDHIGHLQEELRKHQLSSEQLTANSSALKQLRFEIRDMQNQLDRKTRELESLHVCGSSLSLSQPSEDVSIRDQIEATRCPTPDDPTLPPVLPLDHVLKLKETLLKHFRAEDVALKRLKDLDSQLSSLQRQNEELLAEQELLQQTTSEQLFQIEALRARLEQQKQNAPFAQKQATSRLESQLYEMNDKLEITERAVAEKDMELAEIKDQLERMSRILAEKEIEIANIVQSESDIIQKLKDKLEIVEEEKRMMKAKLSVQEKNQSNLPQLIDNMLADKNEEIENLKEQVFQREKQLDIYLSLDETQLREVLRQNEYQKNSARTLSDILSIKSDCEVSETIREAPNITRSENISNLKIPIPSTQPAVPQLKKDVVDFSQEIIETPKVPKLNLEALNYSSDGVSSNRIEISKGIESLHMYVRDKMSLVRVSPTSGSDVETQEDSSEDPNNFVCPRHDRINKNTNEVMQQESIVIHRIKELELLVKELSCQLENKSIILKQREEELMEIQNNLEQLQENIESLNQDRLFYKAEYEMAKMNENKIQKDLEEVENVLKKKTEELEDFKEKIQVNEKLQYEEAKRYKHNESVLHEKLKEISNFKQIIIEKDITIEQLQTHNAEVEKEINELHEYRRKFETYQQELLECQNEIQRLSDNLNNRNQMIRRLEEIARSNMSAGSSPSEKDQEIFHLQEYLKEKDKVIRQMSDDSKSLHRALETIQNKMKESGNVVELRRKLKDERRTNIELTEEIAKLRTEIEMLSTCRRAEEDNIAELVHRELNISAKLDQNILNVIDVEPKNMIEKCSDLKQAKKEIDELNSFKDDLEIEREMLRSQITEYENRILQLKTDTEEETIKIGRLEEELSKKKHTIRSLQMQLQREKNMSEEDKLKDTELISQLRIKLDEALEIKDRLLMEQKNIEVMNAMRDQNEDGLSDLQNQLKKQLVDLTEKLEVEQRKGEEMRDTIKKLNDEKNRIQKQYETAEAEVKKLTTNIESSDLMKDQLKSDLQRAKEELKAKTEECSWQKSILKTLKDAENKRNQRRTTEHSELKNLRRELKNAQEIMLDFQVDMKTLQEQLSESAEREAQLTRCIESLTDKETELTDQLNSIRKENKKLKNIIAEQENEIKIILNTEIGTNEELKRERSPSSKSNSPSKMLQNVKGLNATVERLSQDKMHLHEKVNHLREENERCLDQIRVLESQLSQKYRNNQSNYSKSGIQERMQYFYGKYLRSESRLKSLIYQKKYLFCVLTCYEHVEENVLATLAQLTDHQRRISRGGVCHRYNPRVRFRAVILFVIAMQRMKWLVLRWRTGLRVGANVVLENIESQSSTQPFRHRSLGITERSPPVRDRNRDNGTSNFSHNPYLRRVNNIQQNLHLSVPERNINSYKSN